jgi:predicted DNA-binding protein YlxM (UPF0122 family)
LKKIKITKEILTKKYWEENLSITEIAKESGWSRRHIHQCMKNFEIPRKSLSQSSIGSKNSQYKDGDFRNKQILIQLIEKNMTTREIADHLNISHTMISRQLRKFNLKTKRFLNPKIKKGLEHPLVTKETIEKKTCPICNGKKSRHAKTCRKCRDMSGSNNPRFGKKHTAEARKKMSKKMIERRKSKEYIDPMKNPESIKKIRLKRLESIKERHGQIMPNYNVHSIPIIENFAKNNNLNFKHAENGGEIHLKELGYFLDAYDEKNNIVLEIDEKHHFDINGCLKEKDIIRQKEIIDYLKCKFIRYNIETKEFIEYE